MNSMCHRAGAGEGSDDSQCSGSSSTISAPPSPTHFIQIVCTDTVYVCYLINTRLAYPIWYRAGAGENIADSQGSGSSSTSLAPTSPTHFIQVTCTDTACVCSVIRHDRHTLRRDSTLDKHTSNIFHLVSCRSWRGQCRLPRQWQQQRKLCTSQPFSFESQRSHIWVSRARGGMLRDDSIRIPETARIVGVRLVSML